MTTSITRAASSPGSIISPANGPLVMTSIRRSISTSSKFSFRNFARWKIIETPSRLATVHRIIGFQRRLAASGAFTNPRSHIYYLPELYCAYFGRCYAAFIALPLAAQRAIDPDGAFDFIRARVLAYVQTELIAGEMNVFDAALALIALGHLGADPASLRAGAALHPQPNRRRRQAWTVSGL